MKKHKLQQPNKWLFTALALLPLTVLAQKPFALSGNIKGSKTGDKIYLLYYSEGKNILDSASIESGLFIFKGALSEPAKGHLYLHVNPYLGHGFSKDGMIPLVLEPGQMGLAAQDSLKKAVFTDSGINRDSQILDSLTKPFTDQQTAIIAELQKMTPEQQHDKVMLAPLRNRDNKVTAELNSTYQDFAKNHPKSFISLLAIRQVAADIEQARMAIIAYNALDDKLKLTKTGKSIETLLKATINTTIGVTAMDFALPDTNGKKVKLSDFRGKYVLLDFWASWCAPCRAENPNVIKAYNLYKQQNFTVLGVSLDEPGKKEAWLQAIKKDGVPWTQVSDLKGWNSEAAKLYGINSIPASYLIDPSGKIIAKNLRGEQLQEKLAEIFRTTPLK